jgi:spore germination protein GerM
MRRLLVALAVALLVTGCGVQEDAAPRQIDPQSVPFGLLDPTFEPPSTTVAVGATSSPLRVWLVSDEDNLVAVPRQVAGSATVGKALDTLLAGASQAEANLRLTSALAAGTRLLDVSVAADGTATVDLSRELLSVTGRRQIQALAQIVFTATEVPGVERVFFRFSGRARDVPRGDGQLTSAPLSRRDFRALQVTPG